VREKGAYVRYIGPGLRAVPGVGTFQNGTVAFVPRALAFELLAEDVFEAAGDPKPALQVIFRVGQSGPQKPAAHGDAGDFPPPPPPAP
jgi:hypothetical protein